MSKKLPIPCRALLVDMDGVLWRGHTPIPENIEVLKEWSLPKVFLTNNSTKGRARYRDRIRALGIEVDLDHILTSSYAAARWLQKRGYRQAFVVGEEGLVEELEAQGIEVHTDPRWILEEGHRPEAVVVGTDHGLTYEKIWAAQRAITEGAIFVATNSDATYPVESGLAPGAGTILAAVQTAAGRAPHVIMGKPSPILFTQALEILGVRPEEALMIGDRWDTDIVGARKLGIPALWVLTGITQKVEQPPDDPHIYIARTLRDWITQPSL